MLRRRPDRGSILVLVPAGFLVLMLLAGLAVDSAVAYQAQHGLHDALSAAANDAVGAGLDNQAFYAGGSMVLDPAVVAATVCRAVDVQQPPGLHHLELAVAVSGTAVRVVGNATIDAVFGRIVPGFGTRRVSSTAAASLDRTARVAVGASGMGVGGSGAAVPVSCP